MGLALLQDPGRRRRPTAYGRDRRGRVQRTEQGQRRVRRGVFRNESGGRSLTVGHRCIVLVREDSLAGKRCRARSRAKQPVRSPRARGCFTFPARPVCPSLPHSTLAARASSAPLVERPARRRAPPDRLTKRPPARAPGNRVRVRNLDCTVVSYDSERGEVKLRGDDGGA